MTLEVAVAGAGWAGLAAALECASAGARVTLFEMAPIPGGRARDVPGPGVTLDNGQHICIGAYGETLRLLRTIGVDEDAAFLRLPLRLVDAEGYGLRLPAGRPMLAFARAVLARRGWRWRDRLSLLRVAHGWARSGFACDPRATVAGIAAALPEAVQRDLVEPLCVAALNTPCEEASGAVFLRVLGDALASGRGASDLLLPRLGLGTLFPLPALAWLERQGATLRLAHRVESIERDGDAWRVDGLRFDRAIVAASAKEAARLLAPHDATWAERCAALRYEPIATVYATSGASRLPEPMLTLRNSAERPAQFVFDRGQLGGPQGLFAFVISSAATWVARGAEVIESAVFEQARRQLAQHLRGPLLPVRTIIEKRATFACTPLLGRPPMRVSPGLFVAGDFVEGPYPATLEGAVRSGVAAARAAAAAPALAVARP